MFWNKALANDSCIYTNIWHRWKHEIAVTKCFRHYETWTTRYMCEWRDRFFQLVSFIRFNSIGFDSIRFDSARLHFAGFWLFSFCSLSVLNQLVVVFISNIYICFFIFFFHFPYFIWPHYISISIAKLFLSLWKLPFRIWKYCSSTTINT